jgi:alanyl-tRNA synthetase
VVVLIGAADGTAAIVAALNDAAQARGLAAGDLGRAAAPFLDGKGGGKADLAQGGGTDVTRIDEALAAVTAAVAGA